MTHDLSLDYAKAQDEADPLSGMRAHFTCPKNMIYMDGNSLGVLPKGLPEKLAETISRDWGNGLVQSWNNAGWIDLPQKLGAKIGHLIGAEDNAVLAADSTSINLYKILSAALKLNPDRKVILSEDSNFPTDLYIAEGLIASQDSGYELRRGSSPQSLMDELTDDVAVLMLTHVNYQNGYMHDMAKVNKAAHDKGIIVIWDLAHSAGAVPLKLAETNCDFAVGCGYKYLNGGPGAPAFLYVAPRHHSKTTQPLTGWFSHASPFAFSPDYIPAQDITQYLSGTPPILSMVALDHAMDIWAQVDKDLLRAKSIALSQYFIDLVEVKCQGHGLELITPRLAEQRGSQVSFTHPEAGYAIMQALINDGVIGDFRAPDILRFGITPLYLSFAEIWTAADIFAKVLSTRKWDTPDFHNRKTVT